VSETRRITVGALTRVEGEGALYVRLSGNQIEDVQLSIYEPPRYFEAFLRGRSVEEVPDITARICGICPVAYQMASVHAIERALGVTVTPEIRRLRRLLYCGEWIESHVLHVFMLNAPDFFGRHSGIELAQEFPDAINRGLRMRKIGNQLVEVLGGRAIHPVNVRVGGFYRSPKASELTSLLDELRWALDASIESAKWVSTFDFPTFDESCEFVALQHPDEYAMNEGKIASSDQSAIDVDDYEQHFAENQVSHSTALQASRRGSDQPYFLGPLARLNLNHHQLFPRAKSLIGKLNLSLPLSNRFHSIIARSIEVVHAFEEAISIIEDYSPPAPPSVEYTHCDGTGCAATEAPRGMMFHRYDVRASGDVGESNIVPPTSQNQRRIETDLISLLPSLIDKEDESIAAECEKLIRTYDPCISCSTHFLSLTMERS
jgi:coenzyme F420-reducing hydrogenase alpha subunit